MENFKKEEILKRLGFQFSEVRQVWRIHVDTIVGEVPQQFLLNSNLLELHNYLFMVFEGMKTKLTENISMAQAKADEIVWEEIRNCVHKNKYRVGSFKKII